MSAHPLLPEIEEFLSTNHMAESTFGRLVANDWKLISDLRGDNRTRPRRLWPDTEAKVRKFMREFGQSREAEAA